MHHLSLGTLGHLLNLAPARNLKLLIVLFPQSITQHKVFTVPHRFLLESSGILSIPVEYSLPKWQNPEE
jgi:hypothetical protein